MAENSLRKKGEMVYKFRVQEVGFELESFQNYSTLNSLDNETSEYNKWAMYKLQVEFFIPTELCMRERRLSTSDLQNINIMYSKKIKFCVSLS